MSHLLGRTLMCLGPRSRISTISFLDFYFTALLTYRLLLRARQRLRRTEHDQRVRANAIIKQHRKQQQSILTIVSESEGYFPGQRWPLEADIWLIRASEQAAIV